MSLPLAVLAMVLLLAGFALYLVLVFRLFKRLRETVQQRGYRSPVVLTCASVAAFALPFVGTLLMVRIVGRDDDALWWLLLGFVGVPPGLALAARFLPARNLRTAGRRVVRFPYGLAGLVLLGGAPVIWIAAGVTSKTGLLQLGTLVALGGLGCLEIARRAAAPDAAAVRAADLRPPVVYLRPFQEEEETFTKLPWRWRDFWAGVGRSILRQRSWRFLTLEQYLETEVSTRLGPFIALGNPIDFVPPEGAARTYVADDGWTGHFEEMVGAARCILLMEAISENVLWELAQILSMGLQQRLIVLTRPQFLRKPGAEDWEPFAAALRQTGYQPPGEAPGPGAVVGFDAGGNAVVLKRTARSATETVDAICTWIGVPHAEAE